MCGNGVFRTVGAVSRYSALDQYAMGLRAASEVPPMFLVTQVTSGQSAEDAPRIGVEIRGTRKDVRIADIVAANGTRRPDAAGAPKVFRQAFIYLVTQPRETSADLEQDRAHPRGVGDLLQRFDRPARHDDRAPAIELRGVVVAANPRVN